MKIKERSRISPKKGYLIKALSKYVKSFSPCALSNLEIETLAPMSDGVTTPCPQGPFFAFKTFREREKPFSFCSHRKSSQTRESHEASVEVFGGNLRSAFARLSSLVSSFIESPLLFFFFGETFVGIWPASPA